MATAASCEVQQSALHRTKKTTHSLQGSLLFALFKCEPAGKHIVGKVLLADKALVIVRKRNFPTIAYCPARGRKKKKKKKCVDTDWEGKLDLVLTSHSESPAKSGLIRMGAALRCATVKHRQGCILCFFSRTVFSTDTHSKQRTTVQSYRYFYSKCK